MRSLDGYFLDSVSEISPLFLGGVTNYLIGISCEAETSWSGQYQQLSQYVKGPTLPETFFPPMLFRFIWAYASQPALCSSAPGCEVMDGKILPAPVSWLRSCAANKLMRDINKMTAAHWDDKSAEWAEHLIQHVRNDGLKKKKPQLEPRTSLPGLGCKDQKKSSDGWRQAMGSSAAHGWRGRWTENVKKRGMERGDVKNGYGGGCLSRLLLRS